MKNIILLLLTLPSQYLFIRYTWDSCHSNFSTLFWIVATSLNALPLLFTDLVGVQCLAVVGAVGWVVQYLDGVAKKNKHRGQVL
jgi:hypothetical protein